MYLFHKLQWIVLLIDTNTVPVATATFRHNPKIPLLCHNLHKCLDLYIYVHVCIYEN